METLRNRAYNFLRWTEKYVKTDVIYLTKGGLWLTIGQIAASGSAFVLAVAFAHFFPRHEYGVYKYVLSVASILWTFSLTGIGTALISSASRGLDGALRKGFLLSLRWSSLTTVAAAGVAIYYFIQGNLTLGYSMLIIGSFSPFLNSFGLYAAYLNGKKEFKTSTVYFTCTTIISSISLFATILLTDSVTALVLVYFMANTAASAYFFWSTSRRFVKNDAPDMDSESYSKHLSLMNVLDVTAQHIDKILVFQLLGGIELAVYSFALAMPDQIKALYKNASRLAFPKFAVRSIDDLKRSVPRKALVLSAFIAPAVIAYAISAPFIFRYLFPQYVDAVWYSQLLAVTVFASAGSLPLAALQAHQAKRELYAYSLGINIFQIAANVILVSLLGLTGIVIARIAGRAIVTLLPFVLLHRIGETRKAAPPGARTKD